MKRYNTPHRHRVIKTRLTEEEYAEFSERVTLCKMSQAEFIRQALIKSSIRPVITISPVNDELLSAVGKLTAEYGKIGGNLNQIARCLNEYGVPYNALSKEVRAATAELGYVGWEFDGGRVEANTADNRLQIFFDEKPDKEIREELKGNGFR